LKPIDAYHSSARATSGTRIIGTPFLMASAIAAIAGVKLDEAIETGGLAPAACSRRIVS
jgi:hypothetical protein